MEQACYCKVDFVETKQLGKPIPMEYLGNGKFRCSACDKKLDLSENTYVLVVAIFKNNDDDHNELVIIKSDKKIEDGDALNSNTYDLEDNLISDIYENLDIDKHEEGVFLWELFWNWYSYYTDCGTEYDLDFELFKETKVRDIIRASPLGDYDGVGKQGLQSTPARLMT